MEILLKKYRYNLIIENMLLQEAKKLAQQGVRVTHEYFTDDEWMIMEGNLIQCQYYYL